MIRTGLEQKVKVSGVLVRSLLLAEETLGVWKTSMVAGPSPTLVMTCTSNL